MARHVKMDGRGHVFVPPSAIVGPPPPCRRCGVVMNIHTGVKTDVSMLDAAKGTTRGKVACVGQWIIDCENWRMWKVVVRGSLSIETLTVLGPQSVVPGEGMEIGRSGMFFVRFVDDTAFCVSYRGECVFHRISAAKAFDTGVMVPMDTVKRSVPEQLGIPSLCTFHCCWDSKRVVALGADNTMYEIQEGSQLKVLCRDVMDHFMHGGFLLVEQKGAEKRYAVWDLRGSATVGPRIVTTFAQMVQYRTFKPTGDFCVSEEKGKVHTVDSETGATIFTLTSTNIGYMNCDQLSQQGCITGSWGGEKTQSTGAACVLTNLCYDFVVGSPVTILPLRNRSGARSLICGLQSAMPGHLDLYNVTEGVPCVPSSQRIGSTPQMEPSRISDSMFLTWLPGPNGFRAKYQVWDCSDTRAPLREVVQPQGICLFSIIAEGGFLVRVFEHHIDVVEAMTEFPLLVMEVPERQVMNVVYHVHF
ncbi:hypothetical protein Pelo_7863 [Pelomyxa schiedti]|nr:hypothetical protein Pelo_7863 [Pelomyxa schiedti]